MSSWVKNLPPEDSGDQVYSVVKSFAAKGTLLLKSALEGLAEAKDLDDLVTRLRATVYNEPVTRVEKPYTTTKLEMAFREHLASTHHSLAAVAPFPALIEAYYLKYITSNLKTILKGKALDKDHDDLSRHVNLFPEQLIGRRDIVVRALSSNQLSEAVNFLRESEFGDEVDAGYKAYRETERPQVFDVYLDKALYTRIVNEYSLLKKSEFSGLGGSEAGKVRSILAVDLDRYNVLAVLRAKLWDLEPSSIRSLIIEPTFQVSQDILRRMIEIESTTEAVKQLAATEYRQIVPSGELDEAAVGSLEDGFNSITYRRARATFLWDVFSVSVVLGIIKLKELEERNLAAIAFGVDARIGFQGIVSKLTSVR